MQLRLEYHHFLLYSLPFIPVLYVKNSKGSGAQRWRGEFLAGLLTVTISPETKHIQLLDIGVIIEIKVVEPCRPFPAARNGGEYDLYYQLGRG